MMFVSCQPSMMTFTTILKMKERPIYQSNNLGRRSLNIITPLLQNPESTPRFEGYGYDIYTSSKPDFVAHAVRNCFFRQSVYSQCRQILKV